MSISEKVVVTRKQFVSVFVALAIALMMTMVAPSQAFAVNATSGEITYDTLTATATVGQQINLQQACVLDADVFPADSDAHLDYQVVSGSAATVNKHSSVLTPNSVGSVTVAVYLSGIAMPTGNPNNPCVELGNQLDTVYITVTIYDSGSTYGFQGNDLMIRMDDPTVTGWTYDATAGYINNISLPAYDADGYRFNYTQTSGWGQNINDSITDYENDLTDTITLVDSDGNEIINLTSSAMWLELGSSNQNFNLVIDLASLHLTSGAEYSIVFTSLYAGGNISSTTQDTTYLDVDVSFVFTY